MEKESTNSTVFIQNILYLKILKYETCIPKYMPYDITRELVLSKSNPKPCPLICKY